MVAFFNHCIEPFKQDGVYLGLYGPAEEPCLIRVKNMEIEKIIFANMSVVSPGFHDLKNKIIKYLCKV